MLPKKGGKGASCAQMRWEILSSKLKWKKKVSFNCRVFLEPVLYNVHYDSHDRLIWLHCYPFLEKHFSKTTVLQATFRKCLSLDLNLKENETILCIQQSSTKIYECLPCVPGHRWCTAQSQGATFTQTLMNGISPWLCNMVAHPTSSTCHILFSILTHPSPHRTATVLRRPLSSTLWTLPITRTAGNLICVPALFHLA